MQPPNLVDGVDVDAVARAVRACPGVDGLTAGSPVSSVVSYLPGRQLSGVSVHDDHVAVSVRAVWGTVLPQLGTDIRSRVAPLVPGRRVDVGIAEMSDAPEWAPDGAGSDGPAPTTQGEVTAWTNSDAGPAGSSSVPITPTTVATPPSSWPG